MLVRTVCSYVPRELVEAFGLEARRLIPPGTVASESRGESRSGAGACSWCKSALGSEDAAALWVGGATCDQMRRALELAGRAPGSNAIVIGVPKTRPPESEAFYVEELRWLAGELARRTGRTLDSDKLRRTIEARNLIRARIRKLRPSLSGAAFTALVHLDARCSAVEMSAHLDRYRATEIPRPGIPVLVGGSPVSPAEIRWLELLEQVGLSVVADATCTGDRAVDFDVGDDAALAADPLEALARAYFRRPPCLFVRPNDTFYEYAGRLADERGARGIIWRSLRGCDICGLEAGRAERILGRPLLALDMSYGDVESLRVRNRIEAFAESLR